MACPSLDHFPIAIQLFLPLENLRFQHQPSFKFERMWLHHPKFLPLLKHWWVNAPLCTASEMYQFATKMKCVKKHIKRCNEMVFKNIFKEKEIAKE